MAMEDRYMGGRNVERTVDVLVAVWVAVWLAAGVAVGWNIWQLRDLTGALDSAADSIDGVGGALQRLAGLPLVGDGIDELAGDISRTAAEAEAGATSARGSVNTLSWLLGLVVIVLPSVPVLGLYLPWRARRRREIAEVRQALADTEESCVAEYLAWRAITRLPFDELRAMSRDPWSDLREGRHRDLADRELARLGLPPLGSTPPSS